jgi:S-adenosylmethionine synthetase
MKKTEQKYVFTSESVTEGHPDKVCDQISDSILDELLKQDKESRAGIECFATTGLVVVGGEIRTKGYVDIAKIARETIREIGYNNGQMGFSADDCGVIVAVDEQSADIAQGVDAGKGKFKEQGAGDQGLMFGFACRETKELMPLPIILAHKMAKRLAQVRKNNTLKYLRPDGKTQVAVEYRNNKPYRIDTIVVAAQHNELVSEAKVEKDIIKYVVKPVCGKYLDRKTKYFINATGKFIKGGPPADAGLTGRKIIVDTYGGHGSHGGGCFSGKDPSKVDRSASYMARYIAKNIVASGLADKCEVQLSYVIGRAEPVSILVQTFGTGKIEDAKIEKIVREHFPLKPAEIISHLKLKRPIYKKTAAYGHFGRNEDTFTWEKTDKVNVLKKYL